MAPTRPYCSNPPNRPRRLGVRQLRGAGLPRFSHLHGKMDTADGFWERLYRLEAVGTKFRRGYSDSGRACGHSDSAPDRRAGYFFNPLIFGGKRADWNPTLTPKILVWG